MKFRRILHESILIIKIFFDILSIGGFALIIKGFIWKVKLYNIFDLIGDICFFILKLFRKLVY